MRKLLLLLMCTCLCIVQSWAQNRTITGTVKDENGEPIHGASITVKGTNKGVSSSGDGSFTLSVSSATKTLIISAIGFSPLDYNVQSQNTVAAVLKASVENLQEVVVVGYGVKSIRENTGAIAKIAGEKIANQPVTSLDQALSGQTAGVQVNLSTGVLADRTAIRIRGINSISSSSQPLIVIDGIPQMTNTNLNGFNSGNGTRFDPLALVNYNDIESIDILKDAGAAVLYGSRASNGVILITTKKGKKGNIKVAFDSKMSWSSPTKKPSVLNGDDFTTIQNEKYSNRFPTSTTVLAKDSDIDGDGKPDRTDWISLLYRTGFMTDNTVSFSGGADRISVYGSARYASQEGITLGNKLRTGQTRLNLDFTPKTWFKSGLQLSYSKTLNNGVLSDGYIAGTAISGWQVPSNVSPYNKNTPTGYNLTSAGLIGLGNNVTSVGGVNYLPSASYYYNPIATLALNRNDNTAEEIRANIYGELQPLRGLKFTTKYGIQNQSNFEDQYNSPYIAGLGTPYNGLVQNNNRKWTQWVWQNYVNYDVTIKGLHKIAAVAGAEYQYNTYFYLYTGANNFTDPFFTHIIDGAYTNTLPGTSTINDNTGGDLYNSGMISYFGRLAYSFNNKYFIEGAFRRDGYSAFGAGKQFGNFPSISLGWDVTKESFMSGIKWLDYLKIRGSYGEVGNSRGLTAYASRTLYSGAAYTSFNGLGITQAGNSNLGWESAKKTNIGFDATVLKGRIGVTFDYFNNNINNLILSAPVLYSVGVPNSSITTNIGSMYNRGIELTINATPVSVKDFTWTTSFNFTRVWNKVTSLVTSNNNADITSSINVASLGKQIGLFYLPTWVGVDPNTGNPMWRNGKTGGLKIWDFATQKYIDEKGNATTSVSSTNGDYSYSDKSGLPTYYGGWDNTFSYKQFDLGIGITYQGGNYIYNSSKAGLLTNYFSNNFTSILGRWRKAGDQTDIPRLYQNDNTANQSSTRFLEKGNYIRIRTITLGYNMDRALVQKLGLQNVRLYVQGFNLFTITKYSGLDPEVNSNNTDNISVGIDNRATPQYKAFTIGLNVAF